MLTLQPNSAVRKAIVLVSDGDDDYSRAYESDAIKMCQRAETIVYTISTNYGPSKDKGDDVLKAIAEATGGEAFFPDSVEQVANGFHSHRGGPAQPVLTGIRAGGLQAGWQLPNDLSAGARRTIQRACEEGVLCPQPSAVNR